MRTPRNRFGRLLKDLRRRKGIKLTQLAEASGVDGGNLSRVERGERRAPGLPRLVGILKALGVAENSPDWHDLLGAAAKDRFETVSCGRFTYPAWENPLHGLPGEEVKQRQFGLTEAVLEVGRISVSHVVKQITVKSADGSEWLFPIREDDGDGDPPPEKSR